MALVVNNAGNEWQITNLHGDCVATIHNTDTGLTTTSDTTEYGTLRNPGQIGSMRYGWLGANDLGINSGVLM